MAEPMNAPLADAGTRVGAGIEPSGWELSDDGARLYLARIGLSDAPPTTHAGLVCLVEHHLHHVPFENLDIGLKREIVPDPRLAVEKVALARRGGFCFEVNEAFRALLQYLGFAVRRLEGSVWVEAEQRFGAPFDHLALAVALPEGEFLVDVGFGDNNRAPLLLPAGETQDVSGAYGLNPDGDALVLKRRAGVGKAQPLYRFTLATRSLDAFAPMCRYHQTSEHSIFTRGPICTIATPGGRITLGRDRLVIIDGGVRRESPATDPAQRTRLLLEHFGIRL